MRVMLDTNILISTLLFPSKRFNRIMKHITDENRLVLSSFVLDEIMEVTNRKFPSKKDTVDRLLSRMSYELVYTPLNMKGDLFKIRDMKDYPVLYTAIMEGVDILITGDKDFLDVEIDKPEILTPVMYMDRFHLGD